MPASLEGKDGRPWTASAPLGWVVLIVAFTFGAVAWLLGVYLSLWIRGKGRSSVPLCGFLLAAGAELLEETLNHLGGAHRYDWFAVLAAILAVVLWIGSAFYLRDQIQRHYRETEGWEIEIGPFFTFLFSTVYINYCLGPVTFSEREPVPSLDLEG
jgi:hypothetical protein